MVYGYILEGTSGRYYIGSCQDVARRLERHNSGGVHSTKRLGLPLKLIAHRAFNSNGEARAVEAKLKRWRNPSKAIAYLSQPD